MELYGQGAVKKARKSLGLTAFGMQIFDFPPGGRGPLHDESSSGQEEVYVGLEGSGWIEVEGERVPLGPRVAVFVPPSVKRKTVAGPDGFSFLAIGARPHGQHQAPDKFD